MKRLNVIYARCSKTDDSQDLDHQIQSCQKYADDNRITIDKIITDKMSAYKVDANKREGLNEVRELAHNEQLGTLIIMESSRLSRQMLMGQIIISELTNNNVKIISIAEGLLNSNQELDQLINSIRMFSNESSSKLTSKRIKSSMQKIRNEKRTQGGVVPFGYVKVDKKLIVDEDLRHIIIGMFETYLQQDMKATKEYLASEANYQIREGSVILNMLKNRIYIGYPYKVDDSVYIPELQIIDNSLFQDIQNAIKSRRNNNHAKVKTNRTDFYCESILYHSCGKKMYISTNQSKLRNYTCKRCESKSLQKNFKAQKLDDIISDKVQEFFNNLSSETLKQKWNESRSNDLKNLLIKEKRYLDLLHTKEQTLLNANKKLQEALIKDMSLDMIQILTDSISDLKKSIADLKLKLETIANDISNQKLIEEKQNKLSEQLLDFKYLYSQATVEQKKMLIHQIIDKIIIESWDNIQVLYKY